LKIEVYDLFKPESPPQEHPAFDVLSHYSEDVKLLINKANVELERSLDTILAKYGTDGT
jgi:hypothetical protein